MDDAVRVQLGLVLRRAAGAAQLDVPAHLQRSPPQQPADEAHQFDAQRQRVGRPLSRPRIVQLVGPSLADDAVGFVSIERLRRFGSVAIAHPVAALHFQSDRPQFALPHFQRVALPLQRGVSGRPSVRLCSRSRRLLLDAVPRSAGPARLGRLEPSLTFVRLPLDVGDGLDQFAGVAFPLRLSLQADPARGAAAVRTAAQVAQRIAPPSRIVGQSQAAGQDASLSQSASSTAAQTSARR